MIFKGFKRKTNLIFIKNHINDFLNKSFDKPQNKIKNCLIFVDDVATISKIKSDLIKKLTIEEQNIEIVLFQKKILKEEMECFRISPQNFGWYGRLKQEKFPFSLTKKYDLLINYSKVDKLYLNLLLLQMNSDFKIGFGHLDKRFYNLVINCNPNEITIFDNELKKYLTILNKI